MLLAPGKSLIHYRLVEKIGEGGMGVVWKARDTRLNRDVALKMVPPELSHIRVRHEARMLASLQHPNVASIHGLEESEGEHFIVMELVEGEDLAQRLRRGPVPIKEALDIACQLSEALETAHERGIVHRDLKPANVKLTRDGKVKVLDFGLAKALAQESMEESGEALATLTATATSAGVIFGTAAYMSPEQARGSPVDRRTDVWAFGCVLYETLAGRRLFLGETVSDTLAGVLKNEPDWSLLPKDTPPRVTVLIRRCLRKDLKERLRDIGDARLELAEVLTGVPDVAAPPEAMSRRRSGWAWAGAGLLVGALLTATGLRYFSAAPPAPVLRKLTIPIPQLGVGWGYSPLASPDGRLVSYFSHGRLWVRDLRRFEGAEVPGSEGADHHFWSPESDHIGFAKQGKIWTWSLAGGQSNSICLIPAAFSNGGAWSRDGTIYFATFRGGLYSVAAAGGEPHLFLSPDSTEVDFHLPHFLPGGNDLVMSVHRKEGPHPVVVVSLPEGTRKTLAGFAGLTSVTPSATGHLLLNFTVGRQRILAVPFSEPRLEIEGEPFSVAPGGQFPSVSANGLMVYHAGPSSGLRELVWMDREGRIGETVGNPRQGLNSPAISPDGRKVAVVAYDNENADIWIQDLARGTWSRLVSGPEDEFSPQWSPSGDRIFYLRSEANFMGTLMEVPSDGSGTPRSLAKDLEGAPSISPDGRNIVFVVEKQGRMSLWRLVLDDEMEPVRHTWNTSVTEVHPAISPDGRWLAYTSDEAGREEVFIRLFPGGDQKQQVSLNGGWSPFWSRRGDALYFWEDNALMEVPVQARDDLTLGTARKLLSASAIDLEPLELSPGNLDVSRDGRFLAVRRSSDDPRRGVLIVENWFEEFRKR